MIIHQPEMINRDGNSISWSKVEMARTIEKFPDYIWYRVPEGYSRYLSCQSDAFLVPSLIAAMHFGEDIEVRGAISPSLAYSLEEYQFILNLHFPQYLKRVTIRYDQVKNWNPAPQGIAATFSGGVDSFFTIKKHLPESQPIFDYRLTHALFVQNFDILSRNNNVYRNLFSRYQAMLEELGIELIPLETNLVNTIMPWLRYNLFYGPILAGCAMLLGGLFKRFIISSSRDHYQNAYGLYSSNPLSDRLLSTDFLEIVHYGAMTRRVEKIEAISTWKPAQDFLRVCGNPDVSVQTVNCSRCEKCTRTMLPLYALAKMDQFRTFSKPFLSNRDTFWWLESLIRAKTSTRRKFSLL